MYKGKDCYQATKAKNKTMYVLPHTYVMQMPLTPLSRLKVKLADTCENGMRSNAATAPASLFSITASDAEDGRKLDTV